MKVRLPRGSSASVCARLGLTVSLTAALALPAVAGLTPGGEGRYGFGLRLGRRVQAIPENYHARLDPDVAAAATKSGEPIARTVLTEAEIAAGVFACCPRSGA